jgi:hypothetical protein
MLHWALAGCCAAILVAFVIPKQYVSSAKLMAPEAQSASSARGFGSIAGGIDRFNLKQAYRVGLQLSARA